MKTRSFQCALFLDDDSIVEETMAADTPERAVSMLLSDEAGRRRVTYLHLCAHVLPGGALASETVHKSL